MLLFPFRYAWWLLTSVRRSLARPPHFVEFVVEESLPGLPDPPRRWWQRFISRPRLSIKELGERFDRVGRDPRIKGVVLHLRPVGMPMASLQDLREMVAELRRAGKRVVAWAPDYTTGTYLMPALQPASSLARVQLRAAPPSDDHGPRCRVDVDHDDCATLP